MNIRKKTSTHFYVSTSVQHHQNTYIYLLHQFLTYFFSLVHLHNTWERVEFILDCIIIIISPSPHQSRGCTNNLQFAMHKMDDLKIFLYSNAVAIIFHYKVITCLFKILSCSKPWHSGTSIICSEQLFCTTAQCIIKSFRAVGSIAWLVLRAPHLPFTLFQCFTSDKTCPVPMDKQSSPCN